MDAIAPVPDRHTRDAILLKMILEGKGYQDAASEVASGLAPPAESEARSPEPEPFLTVDVVELQAVSVRVETPDATYEATVVRLRAMRVEGGPPPATRKDPLLLDLDGDGPETTGRAGAQAFDLQGDGRLAPTSWVTGGDAFLALDRDGDGRITSGLELFGDQHGAVDGFAELARFDANGDTRIDAQDPVFEQLRLYDGATLRPLEDAGIQALALSPTRALEELPTGDAILARGSTQAAGRTVPVYAMALQTFGARTWEA